MSSTAAEEIELLERVLLRLGCADTDEKLESCVGRFLTPVILKITSPHDNVRNKVVEVLTHIKRRLTSRPLVQIPVEALIDQYQNSADSPFLQNFAIIFITMGFPRLDLEQRSRLAAKVVCCEPKLQNYQDKLFMLILPDLNDIKFPDDPAERKNVLNLHDKPDIKRNFLSLLQDVLLLPYGITQEQAVPLGMSAYSFKRVIVNNWKAEDLENIKKGIVRLICSSIFTDTEVFLLLVLASSDTRFSVATPAIAELSKVCTILEFNDPQVTMPLYTLFSGNNSTVPDRKTSPCCSRVRQKLLLYLIKCRDKGISVPKGIQVVFEGLFGNNTSQKCKVLSLQFAEILIKEGPLDIITKVSKVLLTGFTKLVGKESNEPNDVQNAAYSALAQLARTCPSAVNQDLKIVLSFFNHLTNSTPELHSSIREALVAMAPAFAWKAKDDNDADAQEIQLTGQQHLLLAMLSDNAESKLHIVQNVTSIFLTTCYPEHYAPARYLLLLIAGERNSLRENVTSYLYGVSKKDHINYNMLSSIEFPLEANKDDFNKLNSEQRRVILPSFEAMMRHVNETSQKRLNKNVSVVVGRTKLPFTLEVYEEILDYLRVCLWYSAGARCAPGDTKFMHKLKSYIRSNYEESENNELHQYLLFIQKSVEAKRTESNLLCLYDLLDAAPDLLSKSQMYLLEPLSNSLRDVSEVMRLNVSQIVGILWAHGEDEKQFEAQISECLVSLPQKSLEHKHGWLLVLGHAFSRFIRYTKDSNIKKDFQNWSQFIDAIKVIAEILVKGPQDLLISAAVKCISMIGKCTEIPNVELEITFQKSEETDEDEEMTEFTATGSTKFFIFTVVHRLLLKSSVRPKIRAEAAKCLGNLAIGDGAYFTQRNLDKFLAMVKVQKDAALNISISDAIASTLCGYDVGEGPPASDFVNPHCNDEAFEKFLNALINLVPEPNPHSRQACSVWLLAVVKHGSYRPSILNQKQVLQYAFTELLSDDSEFVQDVASRGLGLVYSLSDQSSQNDLANSLLDQLMGGKRKVNKVAQDTELFAEGMLGKTPTGGNITTYKELCSLASDLNQPEMIYQFMQLANHNAAWTSKLGAAFGLKSLSSETKAQMEPYFGKIVPRLYRYKYDPTPKIQNSMISIWDSIVSDPKEVVEKYYWEILREILDNLTFNEWRVRIACCLATRDLLRRPNGLKLRTDEKKFAAIEKVSPIASPSKSSRMEVDDEVPEPELKELWSQLFRVMDDIHEGTRLAAQGSAMFLSKLCVIAASSDHGKSGTAVASSILPFLLETGVTHTVDDIRKISIKTISEMIDSSGALIAPHLPSLIPCLLKATGELESTKLSYLSTRLGADHDAQEKVDSLRAEAAKSHHTTETTAKCVRFLDYPALEKMTPATLDLIKTSVNLGTKIACAHFICLISIRIGDEMAPLVGKYLGACFVGLKDRNATVRKYYASAIGHLIGLAKEQSIRNLFAKLDELYMENPANRSAVLVIQSINKRHNELLKDYLDSVLPLIFFAMHEEPSDENKSTIELWRDLWNEISPGDTGIRLNLNVIVPKLEKSLNDASWSRKAQSANAIQTIAKRLKTSLEENDRLRLIALLINALQGRTFQGKERLLQALAALCKGLNNKHEICNKIIESAMKECRKEEPQYRTLALASLGDILEELEQDRFEEVYNMIWYLLDRKEFRHLSNSDDEDEINSFKDLSTDERNKRANILNKLKETVCETLGKSWPKNSIETQRKYQQLFAERCSQCLRDNTRSVQVSLMVALTKFIERLQVLNNEQVEETASAGGGNKEKKAKVDVELERDGIIAKISQDILSAVTYASGIPHTGLKKEALNIILILTKRLMDAKDMKHLKTIRQNFEENLEKFQKDSAPEIRCRIKDIEEKFSKCTFHDY